MLASTLTYNLIISPLAIAPSAGAPLYTNGCVTTMWYNCSMLESFCTSTSNVVEVGIWAKRLTNKGCTTLPQEEERRPFNRLANRLAKAVPVVELDGGASA